MRDWNRDEAYALFPYEPDTFQVAKLKNLPYANFLKSYREPLSTRITFGQTQAERGEWYEYAMMTPERVDRPYLICMPEIATHNHALVLAKPFLASQTAPVSCPKSDLVDDHHLIAGLLNSSAALLWLKLVCFNKGAGNEEERDRFVYAGGKVQQLPIPSILLEPGPLREQLIALSRVCWGRGQQLPGLAYKKLFEQPGEAYYAWNSSLAGWVKPWQAQHGKWKDAKALSKARDAYTAERERLRSEMIALQEEMDWLVYAAYGLATNDECRMTNDKLEPLALGERPFELLRDGKPIPKHFGSERRALWQARLKAIEENEHIRRIEQPVYKRRWYRKESDEREFERALTWWLLEKAEWWLEHKAKGGPVTLGQWVDALWQDERILAAAEVIQGQPVEPGEFTKLVKSIVVESTVPDWIPPALPWEQVEKKFKASVPARTKKIRGKLNVPRERFRLTDDGEYTWAGKADARN